MRRFLPALRALWTALSRPNRPARRAPLALETLDQRLLPTTLPAVPSLGVSPSAALFAQHGYPSVQPLSPVGSLATPRSVTNLLNKNLALAGIADGVTYGNVTFASATQNSDGTISLSGTFTSGTLQINVTGTIGLFYWNASGATANFSFSAKEYNPRQPPATAGGISVNFSGSLFLTNDNHAIVNGQLQVVVAAMNLDSHIQSQPYTTVNGSWF